MTTWRDWLHAQLPGGARIVVTTRTGITEQNAISAPPYDGFNLAQHVGDDPQQVAANRLALQHALGLVRQPAWLEQIHGIDAIDAARVDPHAPPPKADAVFTREKNVPCVVMTADCLPVVLAAADGSVVGVAHAGWKGLCHGVIEALAQSMGAVALHAWLGPCIGPDNYETGPEIRAAFLAQNARLGLDAGTTDTAFRAITRHDGTPGYLCDLHALARQRLAALGVRTVSGGEHCTVRENDRFYSFRKTPVTGRFATLVWLD